MAGIESDDYREGLADNCSFIISKMLDEAVTYEGFTLDIGKDRDGTLTWLSLDWTDSTGAKHYRTLWEKRDG